jgi:hypothetical protein
MLGNFDYERAVIASLNPDGFIDLGQSPFRKLNVKYRTYDLGDLTCVIVCHCFSPFSNLPLKFSSRVV